MNGCVRKCSSAFLWNRAVSPLRKSLQQICKVTEHYFLRVLQLIIIIIIFLYGHSKKKKKHLPKKEITTFVTRLYCTSWTSNVAASTPSMYLNIYIQMYTSHITYKIQKPKKKVSQGFRLIGIEQSWTIYIYIYIKEE